MPATPHSQRSWAHVDIAVDADAEALDIDGLIDVTISRDYDVTPLPL